MSDDKPMVRMSKAMFERIVEEVGAGEWFVQWTEQGGFLVGRKGQPAKGRRRQVARA